jgi:hypothetical protein
VLVWSVIALVHPVAVFIDVIGSELHVEVLWVDLNDDFISSVWTLLICSGQSLYQYLQQSINTDAMVFCEQTYCIGHI